MTVYQTYLSLCVRIHTNNPPILPSEDEAIEAELLRLQQEDAAACKRAEDALFSILHD